jgi:hypothetical protein
MRRLDFMFNGLHCSNTTCPCPTKSLSSRSHRSPDVLRTDDDFEKEWKLFPGFFCILILSRAKGRAPMLPPPICVKVSNVYGEKADSIFGMN